jgi:inner membrane protein
MKHPFLSKALAVGAITLLLCIALMRIGGLVDERQSRQREAEAGVEQSLAGRQALLGPVLHRACTEEWDTQEGVGNDKRIKTQRREFQLVLAPTRLSVEADVALEPLRRALFKVNTYRAKTALQAQWDGLGKLAAQREHAGSRLACGSPMLMVAMSDVRGIRAAQVRIDGTVHAVRPGSFHGAYPRGFHSVIDTARIEADAPLTADIALELAGTAELAIAPVADATAVNLRSDWPHPSFGGRFLPAERQVADSGFTASWRVSSLASTAPEDFARGAALCAPAGSAMDHALAYAVEAVPPQDTRPRGCIETLGVAFIDPISPYSLSDRAIKYGLLFIVLTFATVAAIELRRSVRVHPVQYALVGAALTLFFLLLLSLSEHLPFGIAYALASLACAGLLGYYGAHVLGGTRSGSVFGASIGALYAVLYGLLQLEQAALAMGSLLLFAVLAAAMVFTRRVDWYALLKTAPETRSVPAAIPTSTTS